MQKQKVILIFFGRFRTNQFKKNEYFEVFFPIVKFLDGKIFSTVFEISSLWFSNSTCFGCVLCKKNFQIDPKKENVECSFENPAKKAAGSSI